jgi:hypothetical protein
MTKRDGQTAVFEGQETTNDIIDYHVRRALECSRPKSNRDKSCDAKTWTVQPTPVLKIERLS